MGSACWLRSIQCLFQSLAGVAPFSYIGCSQLHQCPFAKCSMIVLRVLPPGCPILEYHFSLDQCWQLCSNSRPWQTSTDTRNYNLKLRSNQLTLIHDTVVFSELATTAAFPSILKLNYSGQYAVGMLISCTLYLKSQLLLLHS